MGLLTSLWPQIRPLVQIAERPSRYSNHEWGSVVKKDADFHFCMIYPDTYEIGQSNQALRILVNAVNAREGMAAERGFLPAPDLCDALRTNNLPLFSLESCASVAAFDVVGFTLPHELAATNVLEALDLAGIPLYATERTEDDPIVVAGGPCALNPEPYAYFIDAFNIGEGEVALPDALARIRHLRAQGATRASILDALAHTEGWYVPSLYYWRTKEYAQEHGVWIEPRYEGLPTHIKRCVFKGFATTSAWEPCVVPFVETAHDRLNVEILRGCARGCRFCQAGMMYRPVRERTEDNIVEAVCVGLQQTGYDEVSLTSLSSTDHSQIASILKRLNKTLDGKGVRISIPSQRLDAFGVDMAALVAGQKRGGLTFAPEAGTQRLRDVINKNVCEEDLFCALDAAFAAGWRRCKLYFMIGLPTETDDDIRGIARLAHKALDHARAAAGDAQRSGVRISVSVALFVPKAQTPFQWDGQIAPDEAWRRINLLRQSVKSRAIDVTWHDPATSFIEALMSRGGRDVAKVVETAWKLGARFDAWTECFNEQAWDRAIQTCGINAEALTQTTYDTTEVLPWEHISLATSRSWLVRERMRATSGKTTSDCTMGRCSRCGICSSLGMDTMLAAPRKGSQ